MEADVTNPGKQRHKKMIWIIAILFFSTCCIAFVVCAYAFHLEWTGFNASQGPDVQQYQPTKTLWDWLQLLFVPIALSIAAYWLNQANSLTEKRESAQRDQTERSIALDNQQESLLQDYLDRMSDLLLQHNLRDLQVRPDVKNIARARTLTVLPRLDEKRKGSLIRFLYESHLIISNTKDCIQLQEADLSKADLSNFNLSGADLSGVKLDGSDLSNASLSEVKLQDASLYHANLTGAVLRGANLHRANLSCAILHGASFEQADLTRANLTDASLSHANFNRANFGDALVIGAKRDSALLGEAIISQAQLDRMQ